MTDTYDDDDEPCWPDEEPKDKGCGSEPAPRPCPPAKPEKGHCPPPEPEPCPPPRPEPCPPPPREPCPPPRREPEPCPPSQQSPDPCPETPTCPPTDTDICEDREDFQDILDGVRERLVAVESEQDRAQQEAAALKATEQELQQLVQQTKTAVDEYRAAYAGLREKKCAFQEYTENQERCLESMICDIRDEIERTIRHKRKRVKRLKRECEEFRKQAARLECEKDACIAACKKKKDTFECWQNLNGRLNALFDDLKALRKRMGESEEANHIAVTYWLFRSKFKPLVRSICDGECPDLIEPDDLAGRLRHAWCEWWECEKHCRDIQRRWSWAQAAAERKCKEWTDAKANLDQVIEAALSEIRTRKECD